MTARPVPVPSTDLRWFAQRSGVTEFGDRNAPGTSFAPFAGRLLPRLDTKGISYVAWAWDIWGHPDNVLIKGANCTPTDGFGVYVRDHFLLSAGLGTTECKFEH